ncbi:ribbon-helix-helix domain-containing protein [Cerasicoccus maritimus]|uniref:ribbon-helix-helix domain-containing protein n=1 Tax=Cerasicoccus maritimus TaxID=490089 RepID=UPI002852937A|nr:ribbon-helix-helix domain-containing protein [Cerasicoccus maritimus]
MSKGTNKNNGRAPGKTQISISLPQELIDRIDAAAAAENRNRSNFIATALDNSVPAKQ